MINSKALKGLSRKYLLDSKEKASTFLDKVKDSVSYAFLMYAYYPVSGFFSRIYERASRSLAFAKHGWMHYDFESGYLYDIMAFKLKRVYKCLQTGHAIQEKEDMDALKETIKVCERLFSKDYDGKYHNAHNKKWGGIRSKHIPEYDDNGKIKHYRWETSRAKVKTPAQKKKERAEFMKCWENGEKDRIADLDRLNELLKKYQAKWWD